MDSCGILRLLILIVHIYNIYVYIYRVDIPMTMIMIVHDVYIYIYGFMVFNDSTQSIESFLLYFDMMLLFGAEKAEWLMFSSSHGRKLDTNGRKRRMPKDQGLTNHTNQG